MKSDWVQGQKRSSLHVTAVILYAIIIFISFFSTIGLVIGYISFFLFTSIKMVWKMLIFMSILAIVLAVLPFLAPVAIIVMIILFFMRIGFVMENWRPIVAGLVLYGSSIPLFAISRSFYFYGGNVIQPLLFAIMGGVALHFVLKYLYSYGYTSQNALGIMGNVPLVIISFILPFLKLHIPMADVVVMEGAPAGGTGHVYTSEPVLSSEVTKPVATNPVPILKTYDSTHIVETEAIPVQAPNSVSASSLEGQPSLMDHKLLNMLSSQAAVGQNIIFGGNDTYHVNSNVFGGLDIYNSQGEKIVTTGTNVHEGHDIYQSDGVKVASTQPNVFDGYDVVDKHNQKLYTTKPNVLGGVDVLDSHNQKVLETRDNMFGGKDVFDHAGNKIVSIQ